jgi:folate-binding protein YgfZ
MSVIADQYRIIATGAGWIDRFDRGRLRLEGRDVKTFLHALVSNDLEAVTSGAGTYATYLTPQGRMIADLAIYNCGDYFLADVPATGAADLAKRLDLLVFAEDVRVSDESSALCAVAVVGGGAADVVARAFAIDRAAIQGLALRSHLAAGEVRIARTDDASLATFDVFFPNARHADVIGALERAGAIALETEAWLALRIEAGRPAFGIDMTTETIPLEAGLRERAISETKGCYVGQEVIIRVLHRGGGRVARRLVRIVFDEPTDTPIPAPASPVVAGGHEVGRITSAAFSPRVGRVIALALVRRETAEAGGAVTVGDRHATIDGTAG